MSEPQISERRSRRGGGRDARRQLRAGGGDGTSAPFITRNIPPVDILSDEATEIIEANAETILEEIGIDFRDDPEALDILRNVGCDVTGERVHFPVAWRVSCAPPHLPASPNMRAILPAL